MDNLSPDFNKVATDVVKNVLDNLWQKSKSLSAEQINKLKFVFGAGLQEYATDCLKKVSFVKTILYRDKDIHLSNFYVETSFEHSGALISQDDFFVQLGQSKRAVISGHAGSGKSIFMRYCALRFFQNGGRTVPVFAELRYINHNHGSILGYILKEILSPRLSNINQDNIGYALKSGYLVFILDGFDELDFDRREQYLKELDFLRNQYPELTLIVSTRPDESVQALGGFDVFHVASLSEKSAIALVQNLEFDEEIRGKFSTALANGLYESHKEFASNPLLLTMLLLTFDQVGNLPSKMHIFYNQAFEVLVLKHDRLKSLYTRKTFSSLDIEEVRRVLAFVCASSYLDGKLFFTEGQIDGLIKESLEFNQISGASAPILNDLISSFSILKRDGFYVTFVHRSFQEYFAAYFISRASDLDFREVIDDVADRGMTEQTLGLIFDMVPERLDSAWLVPTLSEFVEAAPTFVSQPVAFILRFYGGVQFRSGRIFLLNKKREIRILEVAFTILARREGFISDETFILDTNGPFVARQDLIERFFGGASPYGGLPIEPRSDDNAWLVNSGLCERISSVASFAETAVVELQRRSELRKSKAHLFSRKQTVDAKQLETYDREFSARGTPRKIIDQRTGEERSIPQDRTIRRLVLKVNEDETGN